MVKDQLKICLYCKHSKQYHTKYGCMIKNNRDQECQCTEKFYN